ncbi:uncharacterized protein THITE_2124761 [Thermothielavioides terrestris NRRL 8126]|uniref:AGC-kinase C-terminal domain-containing protein n=1 Tax=Thermothielavioides terrestris (strain ATCC 38088 / NRRL 8126) TaxID=578455 RepID=G2RGJ7_THETT|nr:uncharacterized protein THITE_2124761 [Thermothielavioides terrestris NRRL 8126]AEO71886.1 hypothetical protein THITE_2124761 [Thermothielavioides terrestris NRRL 8126]
MLSHLRLHRRAPSNPPPSQPDREQSSASVLDPAAQLEHPQSAHDVSQPAPHPDARPDSLSQLPPTLPPIARVTSADSEFSIAPRDDAPPPPSLDSGRPPARPAYDEDSKTGFIGGVALQKMTEKESLRSSDTASATASQLPGSQLSRSKPPPPPINTGFKQTRSPWFSVPADPRAPGGNFAKRHDEAVLGPVAETQKGRKGLPFLKNPMSSLLMRRKTAQAVGETELPVPSYDPRIRGTRVHDFSAPRPKKAVSSDGTTSTVTVNTSVGGGASSAGPTPTSSGPDRSTELEDQGRDTQVRRTTSLGDDRPEQPLPQVPPKDESGSSLRTSSSAASKGMPVASLPSLASASVRTTASRQLSLSGTSRRDSVASAVPKHMKSTSSRFSFDMIGAAKQEKLLEERHRQREQEKKPLDDQRHSDERFEDFDEDFDYDAMMDDDGLEERIPGVNADYDDEEDLEAAMDPDNDQENFAGFVFQRSNPASSLATPHTPAMLATPRDANGRVIGFAMTKDTTPELPSADSPKIPNPLSAPKPDDVSGLGIQGEGDGLTNEPRGSLFRPSQSAAAPSTQPPPQALNDDLYFDDGLADELDFEHDGTVFDESIFDNQDTDQFGRPIPGAFAQAKEAMMAAQQQQQAGKRDSDRTSSASAQSAAVLSTGHTSLSAGPQPLPCHQENAERLSKPASAEPVPLANIPSQELAYQAALAEAAQKAAASGKFRRSSSPNVLAGISSTHTTDAAGPDDADKDAYLDDYDDNDNAFENDFDDFDFDDEAIIAEANASALANDSDGFYGQEFGFYSAPIPHHPAHAHSHASSSASSSGVFTTESLFQYANGGYFGPVALNRSTSGRVVSREPNLTPITERSEYSNRNSIMSFTLPPAIGSAASDGRNSALAMSSPGLAQLALMSASGDDADGTMSLSALMKLRSKAWGGSQASLASSSREGSPRSERAVPLDGSAGAAAAAAASSSSSAAAAAAASPYGTVPAHLAGHVRVNSGLSLWSCFEDAAEEEDNGDGGGGGGAGGGTSLAAARPARLPCRRRCLRARAAPAARSAAPPRRPTASSSPSARTRCSCLRRRRCRWRRRRVSSSSSSSSNSSWVAWAAAAAGVRARPCWRARRPRRRSRLLGLGLGRGGLRLRLRCRSRRRQLRPVCLRRCTIKKAAVRMACMVAPQGCSPVPVGLGWGRAKGKGRMLAWTGTHRSFIGEYECRSSPAW